jgi:hypothetical protein
MDLICLIFICLGLCAQIRPPARRLVWGRALPALCTLLAVGAKEAGVVAAPLVFLHQMTRDPSERFAARVLHSLRETGPHLLAILLVFAARMAALGHLGGHGSVDLVGSISRLPWALGLMIGHLSSSMPVQLARQEGAWVHWVAIPSAIVALAVIARSIFGPAHDDAPRPTHASQRECLLALALGAALLLAMAAIYGASGQIQVWNLLLPATALVIMIGGAAEGLARLYAGGARIPALIGAALLSVPILLDARDSPIFRHYRHWERAGQAVQPYLERLSAKIEASSPGQTISIAQPPIWLHPDPNHMGLARITPLNIYSLPSWAALRHPQRRIEFRHDTLPAPRPDEIGQPSDEPPLIIRIRHLPKPKRRR